MPARSGSWLMGPLCGLLPRPPRGSRSGRRALAVRAEALGLVAQRLGVPTRWSVVGGADAVGIRKLCPPTVDLRLTGHLSEREGVELLRTSFLLYLCYPFAARGRV